MSVIQHYLIHINFGFTHIRWCVLALFTMYFPKFCEKIITGTELQKVPSIQRKQQQSV